ncbi:MAG TPA: aminodeoxychorismate synthase component I [Woeseiaceae bacterium]|nr:aminodeoxychorismate synthase component I [Woeseiaceae bacterium]
MLTRILLREGPSSQWLLFESPRDVLLAGNVTAVKETLAEIERRVTEDKLFAAGYIAYEAAPGFDEALKTRPGGQIPLLCFGLFDACTKLDALPEASGSEPPDTRWKLNGTRDQYRHAISRIRQHIARGNCYQVNYSLRQTSAFAGDAWQLFLHIAADAPYAAYLEFEEFALVSASPELLFRLDGDTIHCRPMKGTAARGMTLAADRVARHTLANSTKNRAENIMITDMVRNDLGRVAVSGSVTANPLYALEKYPTLWQMTSTVTATSNAGISAIMAALFPAASITGAPKAASMAIIAELEDTPRGIYTGSIGYFDSKRHATFNVAIRTAVVDKAGSTATYGVGGGIVWDSEADDEYEECLNKSQVLRSSTGAQHFQLLETLRWTREDGCFLLSEHLDRLQDSAEYFDFACDRAAIEQEFAHLGTTLTAGRSRLRLTLNRAGQFSITHEDLAMTINDSGYRIRLAAGPIEIHNPFLYHKTTHREVYEQARQSVADCDDVLLWNKEGFITETTIANVLVEIDNKLATPPVECGLLAGTLRRYLLDEGSIIERKIHVDDLEQMETLELINSVRGRFTASLCH